MDHHETSDHAELRQRNRELATLNDIAAALNTESDLTKVLVTVLQRVAELLNLETGWVWLLREDSREFYLAAALNLPPALSDYPERMAGSCYCLDTYQDGDLNGAANLNTITCSRLKALSEGTGGLRYHASVPLYHQGKHLGVMNLASRDWRRLSENELRQLHTIGDLLSVTIERARLFERSVSLGAAEERNRLAREIHDTLAQGLTAVALRLETADALLEGGSDIGRVRLTVAQALALVQANLEEARRSVLDLRAAPLEGRTLAEALAALVAEVSAAHALEGTFQAVNEGQPLPRRVETGLYRIAQEALNNIVKHAQAQHFRVRLVLTLEQAELTVVDDGLGCVVPAALNLEGRYGLIGMNERARLLGGSFQISGSEEAGTQIVVTVPLV